eukprot:jgi/Tetstr1/421517/TSEL_012464.t1
MVRARPGAPLFGTVHYVKDKPVAAAHSVYDFLLFAFVLFLVVAGGMHLMGVRIQVSPAVATAPRNELDDIPSAREYAPVRPPRMLTEKPVEYRWNVNITAVETEPVETLDITAPGAGGNQANCAEGGADILPGWVCVKRHRLERRPTITPEELKERYYKQGVPVILTDFVSDWKVFTEDAWAPEKLRERFGDKTVNVQMGRESDPNFEQHQHLLRKDMKFREYVDMVIDGGESNDYYLTANNHMLKNREFRSMLDDVQPFFPGFMQQSANLIGTGTYYWLGPKSTITPLHQDAASLFHVHMKGRKLWRFISPDQKHLVYNSFGVYSDVDLLLPWEELIAKYPLMAQATIITEIIQPGETIFIPNGWFHHVISLDHPTTSMSSTVFTHDFSGLEAHLYKRWNSLYKQNQDAGTTSMSPQQMRKKLTAFTNRARAVAPDVAQAAKDAVSTAIEQYQQAMSQGKLTFHPARKALFTAIAGNRDATGMLLWVLSQDDYNKMTTDWKNWLWTNIARNPPLNTIVEVMATQMNEKQDTDEIIQSWSAFQQTGREGRVAIQG